MLDAVVPAQLDEAPAGLGGVVDANTDRGLVRVGADEGQGVRGHSDHHCGRIAQAVRSHVLPTPWERSQCGTNSSG